MSGNGSVTIYPYNTDVTATNGIVLKAAKESVTIDKHDFETRVKNAKKALEKGDKVKATIRFKGRQIAHPELAEEVLKRFEESLSDIADVEIQPKLEGRSMFMQLTPKK